MRSSRSTIPRVIAPSGTLGSSARARLSAFFKIHSCKTKHRAGRIVITFDGEHAATERIAAAHESGDPARLPHTKLRSHGRSQLIGPQWRLYYGKPVPLTWSDGA